MYTYIPGSYELMRLQTGINRLLICQCWKLGAFVGLFLLWKYRRRDRFIRFRKPSTCIVLKLNFRLKRDGFCVQIH